MYLLSSKLFSFEDIFQHNAKFYLKYLIPHSRALGYTLISLSFMFAKRFTWMTLHMSWAVFWNRVWEWCLLTTYSAAVFVGCPTYTFSYFIQRAALCDLSSGGSWLSYSRLSFSKHACLANSTWVCGTTKVMFLINAVPELGGDMLLRTAGLIERLLSK